MHAHSFVGFVAGRSMIRHCVVYKMDFMNMQNTHTSVDYSYTASEHEWRRTIENPRERKKANAYTQFLYLNITCRKFNGNVTLSAYNLTSFNPHSKHIQRNGNANSYWVQFNRMLVGTFENALDFAMANGLFTWGSGVVNRKINPEFQENLANDNRVFSTSGFQQ